MKTKEYERRHLIPDSSVYDSKKKGNNKNSGRLANQSKSLPGNRAVGSATKKVSKEQCSMPRKEPNLISVYQEDNLGLNVHVPEQMSCRPGDGVNCLQVRQILESAEQPLLLQSPYREAIACSTQK
eukprot:Tbor_TRINITY_DN6155_c2_g1::TRINITY_DN6155_c2_g1_i2::g.22660::m.22660